MFGDVIVDSFDIAVVVVAVVVAVWSCLHVCFDDVLLMLMRC